MLGWARVGVSDGYTNPLLAVTVAALPTTFSDLEYCSGQHSTWRDKENTLQDFILGDL